jgi:Phosphotransferase enzyme family
MGDETILWGGGGSGTRLPKARLRDDVVLRDPGPWSATVLALLRHLEAVGFDAAPRVVGSGFADDGREMLTYIAGESPHPGAWADDVVSEIGAILARLHRAASSFEPPPNATWHPSYLRDLLDDDVVISHCDAGPWNWIAREGRPIALIDWEFAGPAGRLSDLAEVVWLNAQLHDDDVAARNGLPNARTRARQARMMLDGYGLVASARAGFVDRMIEVAVRSARAEAVEHSVGPETQNAVSDSGFPFLWGITWRVRSAAWMIANRGLLETVIE